MNTDYFDAHQRHWEDGEALFHGSRLANADHLFGMAAECGLKRLMLAFGMAVQSDGVPSEKSDKVHANDAWLRYETYRSGRYRGGSYSLPTTNPFADWDISQRYANRSHFDRARVDPHRAGAKTVHHLVDKAQKDGLI